MTMQFLSISGYFFFRCDFNCILNSFLSGRRFPDFFHLQSFTFSRFWIFALSLFSFPFRNKFFLIFRSSSVPVTDVFYTTITEIFFCQTIPGHLCDLFILAFEFFSGYRSSPPGTTFLSVLIQFQASNNRNTRITICLRSDCRRACLDMKYPVQFARISRPETIEQHSFLELIVI